MSNIKLHKEIEAFLKTRKKGVTSKLITGDDGFTKRHFFDNAGNDITGEMEKLNDYTKLVQLCALAAKYGFVLQKSRKTDKEV